MTMDFIEYVVSELKSKRLSKDSALALVKQFSARSNASNAPGWIHPLVHTNTSDLQSQRYTSCLTGQETFLTDHKIDTEESGIKKILPGVIYLEMARVAIMDAVADSRTTEMSLTFNNIVWSTPLFVEDETYVHITLSANAQNQIAFEIYTFNDDQPIIHCVGYAEFLAHLNTASLTTADIQGKIVYAKPIYDDFKKMGLLYGPAHQAIQQLYLNDSYVFANLKLPDSLAAQAEHYVLHPSLLDSAFQASIGLSWETGQDSSPHLPFAIEQLRIFSPCSKEMNVRVRLSEQGSYSKEFLKLDIELFDQQGKLCIHILGFSSRRLSGDKNRINTSDKTAIGRLIAVPAWQTASPMTKLPSELSYTEHHLILIGFEKITQQEQSLNNPAIQCTVLNGWTNDNIDNAYKQLAVNCFTIIKGLLTQKAAGKVAIQLIIADTPETQYLSGLAGLLKTAHLENPDIHTQCIIADAASNLDTIIHIAQHNLGQNIGALIKQHNNDREVLAWREIAADFIFPDRADIAFKDNGVYVITGGLGNLGKIFIKEILEKTRNAQVIATGRKEITLEIKNLINEMSFNQGRLHYRQLDIVNYEEVSEFFNEVQHTYQQLNGILHCAGMATDNFILKKTSTEFLQVMEPKVDGTVNLDRATSEFKLDFLVLFSSIAATFGNSGQADYAAANGFMDHFASQRNRLVNAGKRHGLTMSLNWPLWLDGGFSTSDAHLGMLEETLGMHPMKTIVGVDAFYHCLSQANTQALIIEGDIEKLRNVIFKQQDEQTKNLPAAPQINSVAAKPISSSNNSQEKTIDYLKSQLASLLKIAEHKLDAKAQLEVYGIDSILAVNLTNHLEKTFGRLPKTLFFEYQTLAALASYFLENHQQSLQMLININEEPSLIKENQPLSNQQQGESVSPHNGEKYRSKNNSRKNRFAPNTLIPTKASEAAHPYEPIAIIGLSGRYPESVDIDSYWNNLSDGKDCVTEVPTHRWDWKKYYNNSNAVGGQHTSKWGGFIDGVDEFDPKFFNISPREAEHIDPQERLFLQHSWLAIEDAGYTRPSLQISTSQYLPGQVGVYVGVMYGEYNVSGSLASIANRVSYFLNVHGPSLTLDTMCSSSLTSIHLACQDLILKRTDLGIAGGVNVSVHPNKYSMLSAGQFISSDGHCQSFGEGGDGYIPGEGVGAVVLKRLSEAKRDGNVIYGVIRGSALNHGGKTNGYTVPNPQAQTDVIERALQESGINPRHISYLEAHGTGTKLGDPIEVAALAKAFQKYTTDKQFCLLGSAKSNIGHCESAAGIAGLTKILLQMKYRKIVPSLHSAQLNPNIDFGNSPFIVNQVLTDWDTPSLNGAPLPLIAGLSSFGAGGANAHIILEEYQEESQATILPATALRTIIPLSARTPEQLRQKAADLLNFVRKNSTQKNAAASLLSLAYTLQVGREAMDERAGFIVDSIAELEGKLQAFSDNTTNTADIYLGQVKNNRETLSILKGDEDFSETVDKWIVSRKISKLLDLWVKGFDLDWRKLYGVSTPKFISLPGYPFAKEKYWIDPTASIRTIAMTDNVIHPLLQVNTSNFYQQSYESSFSGDEFAICDYRVNGRAILSADIFLGMSNVAIEQAWPTTEEKVLELKDIRWGKPYECQTGKKLFIELFPQNSSESDETIEFEIYSEEHGEDIVHCQGSATYVDIGMAEQKSIDELKSLLNNNITDAGWLYQQLAQCGYAYGSSLKTIGKFSLYQNHAVAKLEGLDLSLTSGVMAAVTQLSAALNAFKTMHVTQINSIKIRGNLKSAAFLWIRRATHQQVANSIELHADVYDVQGNLLLQIQGLTLAHFNSTTNEPALLNTSIPAVNVINKNLAVLSELDSAPISSLRLDDKPESIALTPLDELPTLYQATATEVKAPALQLMSSSELENVEIFNQPADSFTKLNPIISTPAHNQANDIGSYAASLTTSIVRIGLTELQAMLKRSLADALFLQESDVELDKSFVDLGLDSIVGVEWIKVINKYYSLNISATRVYDYSTVTALASYIQEEIEKTHANSPLAIPAAGIPHNIQIPESENPATATIIKNVISKDVLQRELQHSLSAALYLSPSDIDLDKSFVDLGLDSIVGVEWIKTINKQYNLQIPATRVYDYSNIKELANYLQGEIAPQVSTEPLMNKAPVENVTTHFPVANSAFTSITSRKNLKRIQKFITNTVSPVETDKVAIIGMSGRYPKSGNLQEYWDNLVAGRNAITEVPASRWDVNDYYDADPTRPGKIYCKWLGALDDVDMFDPLFFQISPSEAELMDPQHRLFMQESYRAFEDAGYCATSLSGKKCGVYMGIMSSEYAQLLAGHDGQDISTTGNSFAIGAARIAYYLNLKGPAIPIDTACSSSLVAIHLGAQALLNREVDMALAGGVSLYLIPESYLGMCQAGMLSSDGQCKTFDNTANGFVPGEGAGAIILKRLSDAERDGDFIHGVLLGSAINQDGKTNGITAPSVNSQIELERDFYARYNINPESISYVEAHGTGTKLGDPIELEALTTVYSEKTSKKNFCGLGSVKTNIGHTSGAAGVASVQKVLLCIKHKTLVPSLNITTENTHFDFKNSPFYISTQTKAWDTTANPLRRAAVSSFGFSGTNAHLVIEEYPHVQPAFELQPEKSVIVPLSARTSSQLIQRVEDLAGHLELCREAGEKLSLTAIAYTLQTGRDSLRERLALVVSSTEQLQSMLIGYLAGNLTGSGFYLQTTKSNPHAIIQTSTNLDDAIANWLDHENHELARLWAEGMDIDWKVLYKKARPIRVNLPGYPFAKERYWAGPQSAGSITPINKMETTISIQPTTLIDEPHKDIFYAPAWIEEPQTILNNKDWSGKVWILDDTAQLSDAFILQNPQADVCWVKTSNSMDNNTPDSTNNEENPAQVVKQRLNQGQIPDVILINLSEERFNTPGTPLEKRLKASFYRIFELCNSLMQLKQTNTIRLFALVANSSSIIPAEYAALGAFFRSMGIENAIYSGAVLHYEGSYNPQVMAKISTQELLSQNITSPEISYRAAANHANPQRLIKTFRPINITDNLLPELPLKYQGVYVITGGLGGLGCIVSDYLASKFNANLVLIGRSKIDAEQESRLEQLRKQGANAVYYSVDIANYDQITKALEHARTAFGSIQGVIHCAGTQNDSLIINKHIEDLDKTLTAKVYGTLNLDQATAHDQLDLFVMFSSIAGALGNPGQSDYAFANHFMDAFAIQRESLTVNQTRSGKTLSINWPYWLDGGMTLSAETQHVIYQHTGITALEKKRGINHFELLLRAPFLQVLPIYGLPSKIKAYINSKKLQSSHNTDATSPTPLDATIDQDTLFTQIKNWLRSLVSKETKLSLDRIDDGERFEAYGFDSIMIGRFNTALGKELGELPKTLLYQYETIHELATYLIAENQQALIIFFGKNISPATDTSSNAISNNPKSVIHKENQPSHEDDPIAIIGVHGYYPQSDTLDSLWQNLMQSKDLIEEIPENRWDNNEFFDANPSASAEGKIYCKWGGFLHRFDKFDAEFFTIGEEEAKAIDPQERLFLQSVWSVIEDAGYTREQLKNYYPKARSANVGVFVGVTTNSYHLLAAEEKAKGNVVNPAALPWSIANRVSYYFDFQGPSMPVDTACSSSLVALHLACESLKNKECQVAIAGGVNLYLHPSKYQAFCTRNMLAANGKCRSFGAGDDGFIPGEGVGTVMLKPLSQALKDRDNVYAVIRGSAYDHCGRSNGYSAPNPNSQAHVINKALEKAGVSPETIGYIEAHATGTQLGDSLEIGALTQVFNAYSNKKQSCAIGSLKTNMGHAESASSIAGLTKIILQLQNKYFAPSLHSEPANPNIDFENSPFYVPGKPQYWNKPDMSPRRAMLNAFGAGGVNACMIIEEHEQNNPVENDLSRNDLFIFSAKTEARLQQMIKQFSDLLKTKPGINTASLCYTLQVGREAMEHRLAIIAANAEELIVNLDTWLSNIKANNIIQGVATTNVGRTTKNLDESPNNNDWFAIAKAWVNGERIHWSSAYSHSNPGRISLPTYPFQENRYWIADSVKRPLAVAAGQEFLHPLVSHNTSTLKQVSFCSYLNTQEYYAVDHVVNGNSIFPGAGYLEIACIAGTIAGEQPIHKIRDIVWIQPLDLSNGNRTLRTFLRTIGDSTEFEITSIDDNNEIIVHSEGRLQFIDSMQENFAPESIALKDIYEQCQSIETGAACYDKFKKYGFTYGPGFQPIKTFYTDGSSVALAQLELAATLIQDFDQYILHPAIIDGALQTVIGLVGTSESDVTYLPFALDEVEIYGPLTTSCFVLAQSCDSNKSTNADIKKYNIHILNLNGDVLVKLNNFYIRSFVEFVHKNTEVQKAG